MAADEAACVALCHPATVWRPSKRVAESCLQNMGLGYANCYGTTQSQQKCTVHWGDTPDWGYADVQYGAGGINYGKILVSYKIDKGGRTHLRTLSVADCSSEKSPKVTMPGFANEGAVDVVDDWKIAGWACSSDDFSTPIGVQIYADAPFGLGGRLVATTTADIVRNDLPGAGVCGGFANHGFNIPMPPSLLDGPQHPLYIYGVPPTGGYLLANSPQTIANIPNGSPPTSCGALLPGQRLVEGQSLQSCDGRFNYVMQGDGNLVLYGPSGVLWSPMTEAAGSTQGYEVIMQPDGNLVVYSQQGIPLWNSGTWGHPGAYLAVQTDGNLVVYSGSTPIWARFGL